MPEQYKTTFNYLLTHKVMPHKFYSNLTLFYESIITNPKNMQLFMKNCVKTAIEIAKKNPNIEPGINPDWTSIEQFIMKLTGEVEKSVILISIPNCLKDSDCQYIAIPCVREMAGYYTNELSMNPANGESSFIAGEWTSDYHHSNFGKTDSGADSFAGKIIKIVYGGKNDNDMPTSNNEIEDLLAGLNEKTQEYYPDSQSDDALGEYSNQDETIQALTQSALLCYKSGRLKEALEHFNNLLEIENSEALFFHCRCIVNKAMGNKTAADYDLFRAKFIDMINNNGNQTEAGSFYAELENELGIEQRKPLIVTEKWHKILQNKNGELLFCIKNREDEVRLPEIFYSGGKNALLRRRMDQYILLCEINKDEREMLNKKPKIPFAELIPDSENKSKGIAREYQAAVRLLPENITLDTIEDICKDGYPVFTSLASFVRANMDKSIKEIILKDDFPNLAAILIREENYQLLEKYITEGLPLNERIGWWFKSWQPTPLFYITLNKIWSLMKDPVKMLNYLKKNKADFDLTSIEGDTPLGNQCTLNGSPEIMKALLDCGANPNADTTSGGYSIKPLQLVLFPGEYDEEHQTFTPYRAIDAEKAKLLIERSADVNADNEGLTPLVQAITYGRGSWRAEIVTLLLKRGADADTAIKYMEGLAKEGSPVYCYALYEFYAGFPDNKTPMPELSAWKNPDTARYYLELSEKAGYKPVKT